MDLALAGRIALIESIEQDAENRVYLACCWKRIPEKTSGCCDSRGIVFSTAHMKSNR
jgi:hypothetical protein